MRSSALLLGTTFVVSVACTPEAPLAPDAPRVFFVGLEDGDRVESPLVLELAAENFEIEPVGDGMVRSGAGHFHLGVGARCLPPRTVIPTASPWIHFTDGSSSIDIDLEPGRHRLVLQAGDGAHKTIEGRGLCTEIEITVKAEDS